MGLNPDRVSAFYSFMRERESIRLRRLEGLPRDQWTTDTIFKTFSFTNVKRDHDRITQIFRRLYESQIDATPLSDWQNCCDLLMSCAVYRFFGTEKSANVLGPYTWARTDDRYEKTYVDEIRHYGLQGDLTFTSAYIIPACGRTDAKYEIVADILEGVLPKLDDVIRALQADDGPKSWEKACEVLCSCYGVGSFMAKEILLDYLMMDESRPDDWQTWTPVGPGGRRGAARVKYGVAEKIGEFEALTVIRELYSCRQHHWAEESVPLDLTDVQFQLCEFDKYSRVAEGRRPKRLFRPTVDSLTSNAHRSPALPFPPDEADE